MLPRWVTPPLLQHPSPRGPGRSVGSEVSRSNPEGSWPHCPGPAEESVPRLGVQPRQRQEEVPSSQGALGSVGISGNGTNEKTELRLSPAEENLRADPSGEHSTSQFKQELELWPGMHLKSPLQTNKPTKPFGLLGL